MRRCRSRPGDVGMATFQQRGEGEDVAKVVVDEQDLHPLQAMIVEIVAPRSGRGGGGAGSPTWCGSFPLTGRRQLGAGRRRTPACSQRR